MRVSHTIMCVEEFKSVFSCHFCIPNVVSQTYAVINWIVFLFLGHAGNSFEKAKWKTFNNNHHHLKRVIGEGLVKCSFQALIWSTNYLALKTLIFTSSLLASVTNLQVKHNKSTVLCAVSFTYRFYKIDLPCKPSLGSRPIEQCVLFSNGWPVIKSPSEWCTTWAIILQ